MFASALSLPEAILLGIVEGITEFLPVSSTGHLLVVGELIGFGSGASADAADTYSIAIQFGAILAVLFLYRSRIGSMARGIGGADPEGRTVLVRVAAAFLPAAVLGVMFGDLLKDALFGPIPITIAWAVGGIFLLVWKQPQGSLALHQLSVRSALLIGLAQGIALWPGVSRSLVTLVAALAIGLSLAAALEFSFLLGLVTLSAATFYDMARNGTELIDQFGVVTPIAGLLMAFITALLAVRWLVAYLTTKSLAIFGWYRLLIAAISTVLLVVGVL